MATRSEGILPQLDDYHTSSKVFPGKKYEATLEALPPSKHWPLQEALNLRVVTGTSHRYYLQGSLFRLALWLREGAPFTLEQIAEAMVMPADTPYLGRKCCLLALPMCPSIHEGDDPVSVLKDPEKLPMLPPRFERAFFRQKGLTQTFAWEGEWEGVPQASTEVRRDRLIRRHVPEVGDNRTLWLFGDRREHYIQTVLPPRKDNTTSEPDNSPQTTLEGVEDGDFFDSL